jgi:hypothetical protein
VPSIFQSSPFLVVLRAGGQSAAKFKVPLIENAVADLGNTLTGCGAQCTHHARHDRCGLPLARRDAGIQVGESRLEKRLSHVGSNPSAPLQSGSVLFAHS